MVEIRPDPLRHRSKNLVHAERVAVGIRLELLILEACQGLAVQAVAQDDLLDPQDLLRAPRYRLQVLR